LVSAAYSWNRIANVLYIESPCGVGFSYSSSKSDYITSDNQTAIDNYVFLQQFFQIYPEWSSNEFWITGESYAGIYIPTLAYQIIHNTSSPTLAANLKRGGLMLGNPVTGCDGSQFGGEDDILFMNTRVNLFYWHAMASRRDYDTWNSNQCNTSNPPSIFVCLKLYETITRSVGSFVQPLRRLSDNSAKVQHKRKVLETAGAINPDCLYYSYCTGNVTMSFNTDQNPDCFSTDDQIKAYLNDPDVQKAINAQVGGLFLWSTHLISSHLGLAWLGLFMWLFGRWLAIVLGINCTCLFVVAHFLASMRWRFVPLERQVDHSIH
jgi:serine carboxypeptidase-like clade II